MRIVEIGPDHVLALTEGTLQEYRPGSDAPRALAAAHADRYSPTGALAVRPDGAVAWFADLGRRARRVDLRTSSIEEFEFRLVDAAYVSQDRVVAVVGDPLDHAAPTPCTVVEWSELAPAQHQIIALPEPRVLAWPYGSPYQYRTYTDDWEADSRVRVTATQWGLVITQTSGLVLVRRPDASWRAWRIESAYQGWIVGFAHERGVVITSLHNGRTGDIVWVDHDGNWVDCYESEWERIGPCVPCGTSFFVTQDDAVLTFDRYPVTASAEVVGGGRSPGDASPAIFDARRVVLDTGGRWEIRVPRAGAAPDAAPPQWRPIDDPDLGVVMCPNPELVRQLVARGSQLATTPGLPPMRPWPRHASDSDQDFVYRVLSRNAPPDLSPRALRRVLARLARGDEREPFVAWLLRESLPEAWRGRDVTEPIEAFIMANAPSLHEGTSLTESVTQATISAEPGAQFPWYVRYTLASGETHEIRMRDFWTTALGRGAIDVNAPEDARSPVGDLDGDKVTITIEPLVGGLYQLTVNDARGTTVVKTGASFQPIELSSPDDARLLHFNAEASSLSLGRRGDRWVVDLASDELIEARPLTRAPRPEIQRMIDELIAAGELVMRVRVHDTLLLNAEAAVYGNDDVKVAATALADALIEDPGVEELIADDEQLVAAIGRVRPA